MAAAASNKTTSNKEIIYPKLEEQAFQFILDSCESSIAKYTKFLQVIVTTYNYSPVPKCMQHIIFCYC